MPDLPAARILLATAPAQTYDLVVLTYDDRLIRRKRLTTVHNESFLVDLPGVTNLDDFWGFRLDDGRCIQVLAAEEPLLQITAAGQGALVRIAWHVGNRHTPCQIEPDRLLIRRDHVLEAMLRQLGAGVAFVSEPFTPEGGAYGHGRTMGHSHGPDTPSPDTPSQDPHSPEPHSQDPAPAEAPRHDDGTQFGWHHHGDGHLHAHPPAPAPRPLPSR